MKILDHLNRLDTLIVEHTTPPATAKIRNYLSVIIEQAETEGDLPEAHLKKEAEHAQTEAALKGEIAILKKKLAAESSSKDLEKLEADQESILSRKMLNHDL